MLMTGEVRISCLGKVWNDERINSLQNYIRFYFLGKVWSDERLLLILKFEMDDLLRSPEKQYLRHPNLSSNSLK